MSKFPKGLKRPHVQRILRQLESISGVGPRLAEASGEFMGCPYREGPLVGSSNLDEVFTVSLEVFDCVTYVETCLALARASRPEEFVDNLRLIRYSGGIVDWRLRNHYMTHWIHNNQRQGIVRGQTLGAGVVERRRRLNLIDGLPEVALRVRSVPKRELMKQSYKIRTGDLAFFASTRRNRDVFHCGIILQDSQASQDGGVRLRHASLGRGRVVEQDLAEFLSANRMTGVILVRPSEVRPREVAVPDVSR